MKTVRIGFKEKQIFFDIKPILKKNLKLEYEGFISEYE